MADESSRLRARARLALRAERAFGLTAIPLKSSPAEAHPPDGPVPPAVGAAVTPATRPLATPALPFAPETASPPVPLQVLAPSREPFDSPVLSTAEKVARLIALDEKEVRGCRRCRLCEQRTRTVFGEGSPDAKIVFIGEGPGQNEDEQGRPFCGRSGDLLTKQINAMGLNREDVYIANVVKCRPPQNREPAADEVATCTPYLERQLEIIRPLVIVTLGRPAAHHMLNAKQSMSSMRGQWHAWRGIKLMPTFHPAYLLRSYTPANRAMVWSDLQMVMRELGMPVPRERRK